MNLAYCSFLLLVEYKSKVVKKETLNEKCKTQDIVKNCFMASLKRKT